jgi:hypothetical protein
LVVIAGSEAAKQSSFLSSWPGLTRPCIFFGKELFAKMMDTRVKPAYDAFL